MECEKICGRAADLQGPQFISSVLIKAIFYSRVYQSVAQRTLGFHENWTDRQTKKKGRFNKELSTTLVLGLDQGFWGREIYQDDERSGNPLFERIC